MFDAKDNLFFPDSPPTGYVANPQHLLWKCGGLGCISIKIPSTIGASYNTFINGITISASVETMRSTSELSSGRPGTIAFNAIAESR